MAAAVEKLKGDKRRIAAQMKADIQRGAGHKQLSDLLDLVLNPDPGAIRVMDEWETEAWCRYLISGGKHFEEFKKSVLQFDDATTCGLVWTSNFVAYRCRTCGISPCMSICADCFHAGDHEGHDFNMFRSQAGGACDCGDPSVMRDQGFCSTHGPNRSRRHSIPSDLLPMAEIIIPRLAFRLLLYLRDQYRHEMVQTYLVSMPDAEPILGLLHDLCKLGGAMRAVMTRALTNPQVYKSLTQDFTCSIEAQRLFIEGTQAQYKSALDTLHVPDMDGDLCEISSLSSKLVHKTFLDELVFWTVKYEFPQNIVTFLLNMLPDNNYKEPFTQSFVQHYGRMAMSLSNAVESDKLANRVVHISVQLFSNEDLAFKMTQSMQLIHVLICSVSSLVHKTLIYSPMSGQGPVLLPNKHKVINCEHTVMKKHCYWPIISDLTNVFSHKGVVESFFSDPLLMSLWAKFLSYFMGMNLNVRQMKQHVEFEPNTYSVAFSAELEACAAPMWQLALHCKDSSTQHYTIAMLKSVCEALQEWLSLINITGMPHPGQVSFHLPLLRQYALFLSQAVIKQELKLDNHIPSESFLEQLIVYPLQIQAMLSEIFCGMWVRNGVQIKCQAMTYVQCHFCASMADLDIFFLQVCATKLDPDKFISIVMDRFKVLEWFTFDPDYSSSRDVTSISIKWYSKYCHLEAEQEKAMLEGALRLLLTLLAIKTHRGMSDDALLSEEIVSLLCMHDRTHSQLTDHIPEKTGLVSGHENFEEVLKTVGTYHDPLSESGGLQQGHYSPKASVWCNEFNPLHVMLRAMQRKDFQSAMDRYTAAMKQSGKWTGNINPWPPFQPLTLPCQEFEGLHRILHTKTLHGIIFNILFKAVNTQSISDATLYYCIALLDMALQTTPHVGPDKIDTEDEVSDLEFGSWFPGHVLLDNLVHTIKAVEVSYRQPPASNDGRTSKAKRTVTNTDHLLEQMLTEEVFSLAGPALGGAFQFETVAVIESSDEGEEEEEVDTHEEMEHNDDDEIDEDGEANAMEIVHETGLSAASMIDAIMDEVSIFHEGHDESDSDDDDDQTILTGMSAEAAAADSPMIDMPSTSMTEGASASSSSPPPSSSNEPNIDITTRTIPVDESLLTLLLKLYTKLSEKNAHYLLPSVRPDTTAARPTEGHFVGGGVEYIQRFLDKVSVMHEGAFKILEEYSARFAPSKTKTKSDGNTTEDRRKKAREAQKKLFAKLAAEQMKFLQTTDAEQEEEESAPSTSADTTDATDRPESPSKKRHTDDSTPRESFDCVICGQNAPSTVERPMGYAVLLQATSVLGHQSQISEPQLLPISDVQEIPGTGRCYQVQNQRLQQLQECFDKLGSYCAVSIGWQGGVHVQTCGHMLHLDCHDSYVRSLKRNEFASPHLKVKKGEFECPLCRQLANSVMPCLPEIKECPSHALVLANRSHADVVKEISQLVTLPQLPSYGAVTECGAALDVFYQDIAREGRCKETKTMSGETFAELCSTARVNLELDLVCRGGSLVSAASTPLHKRSCLGPLLQVINQRTRVSCFGASNQLWRLLTTGEANECSSPQIDAPALLMDPVTLLVELIISLPQPPSKEHFCGVVRVVYSLLYIQALAVVSCKFPAEEREAWKQSGQSSQGTQVSLDSLLSQVISHLSETKLYEDPEMYQGLAICQSIWSPQTVETSVEQYCLPFLRCASLLKHHIFKEDLLPCTHTDIEFEILANYLNLGTHPPPDEMQQSQYSARCVHFAHENHSKLITFWCKQLIELAKRKPPLAKSLLLYSPIFFPPRLLQLPKSYDEVFRYYRLKKCLVCCSVPSRPAICLVCGTIVCLRSTCCQIQNLWEGVQHSRSCGSGTGIYLDINYSGTLLIRGDRMCRWASVYLDSHGEEDQDLRRGKPLYLCLKRYQFLEHLWKSHSLNHMCKGWNWHGGMQ